MSLRAALKPTLLLLLASGCARACEPVAPTPAPMTAPLGAAGDATTAPAAGPSPATAAPSTPPAGPDPASPAPYAPGAGSEHEQSFLGGGTGKPPQKP